MKILVGYDGSAAAENALNVAITHARAFDAKVIIARSMKQEPNLRKEDIEKVEGELEQLKAPFNKKNIPCETIASVNYMSAGEDLVRLAIEEDIDEIIVGVEKKSKVGKLLFGSTSQYVILNAPCPVLAVK